MGCFSYICECEGKTCTNDGRQFGGNHHVVIEVLLNDGNVMYIRGDYDDMGAVEVGDYLFTPKQFVDDDDDFTDIPAQRIWTYDCYTGDKKTLLAEVDDELVSKCVSRL